MRACVRACVYGFFCVCVIVVWARVSKDRQAGPRQTDRQRQDSSNRANPPPIRRRGSGGSSWTRATKPALRRNQRALRRGRANPPADPSDESARGSDRSSRNRASLAPRPHDRSPAKLVGGRPAGNSARAGRRRRRGNQADIAPRPRSLHRSQAGPPTGPGGESARGSDRPGPLHAFTPQPDQLHTATETALRPPPCSMT